MSQSQRFDRFNPRTTVLVRLVAAVAVGVVAAVGVGLFWSGSYAAVVGWIAAAAVFLIATWVAIGTMSAADTAKHATREDPTRGVTRVILILASIASLGGVALLLTDPGPDGKVVGGVLGILSVAAAWFTVHTLFTLQYAALYYGGGDGGISFNQKEPPAYAEFAYLGFTLGMTYQVSDTDIQSSVIRRTALRHALLSYLLGAVVLAISINLVGNIAK